MKITIGIADDHTLFLKSLSTLINSFPSFRVVLEALNGEDLLSKLRTANPIPDILLLDVNMPVLNGIRTSARITREHPNIKTIALSMKSDDTTVIGMLRTRLLRLPVERHPSRRAGEGLARSPNARLL